MLWRVRGLRAGICPIPGCLGETENLASGGVAVFGPISLKELDLAVVIRTIWANWAGTLNVKAEFWKVMVSSPIMVVGL